LRVRARPRPPDRARSTRSTDTKEITVNEKARKAAWQEQARGWKAAAARELEAGNKKRAQVFQKAADDATNECAKRA
jgi:hypothetical protein